MKTIYIPHWCRHSVLSLTILFLFVLQSIGQSTFQRAIGGANTDKGNGVATTFDGGFAVAGLTNTYGAGSQDIYIMKTNANGATQWFKTFGGGQLDRIFYMVQTSDSGFVMAGQENSFGPASQERDGAALKVDKNGNLEWYITLGGGNDDIFYHCQQTNSGGYIFAGRSESFAADWDPYLVKVDKNGIVQWSATFGDDGSMRDDGRVVAQTSDNGFAFAGRVTAFGSGGFDVYLVKTDNAGALQWSKTYGNINDERSDGIVEANDSGLVIAGRTDMGSGGKDGYLIKTDAAGNLDWSKTYGGTLDDRFTDIKKLSGGGYILIGKTTSFGAGGEDLWLVQVDDLGNVDWSMVYGGTNDDRGSVVEKITGGGFLLGGTTNSFGSGGDDIYFIRTDGSAMSGCNESSVNPTVTVPTTLTLTPATVTDNGASRDSVSPTVMNHSPTNNTQCAYFCPIADFTTDTPCVGDSVQYTDLSTSGGTTNIVQWEWRFIDGTTSSQQDPAHLYNSPGTYNDTLIVSNDETPTCRDTIVRPVTVKARPVVSAQPDTSVCFGDTAEISATGGSNISWMPNIAISDTSVSNPIVYPDSTVHYIAVLDSNGCLGYDTATVTVHPQPIFTFGVKPSNCGQSNGKAWVDSLLVGTLPLTYVWGTSPLQMNDTANNLSSGSYTVTITDSNGCTSMDTTFINDLGGPTINLNLAQDPLCFGEKSGLIDIYVTGGTSPYNYAWSNSDSTEDIDNLSAGNYSLTVTDSFGCVDTTNYSLSQPDSLTAAVSKKDATCEMNNGAASVNVNGGTLPYEYNWSFPASNTDSITNLSSGTYFVTITDSNGCKKVKQISLSTTDAPEVQLGPDITLKRGADTLLRAEVSGGTPSYDFSWKPANKTSDPYSQTTTITTTDNEYFIVSVTDQKGCIDSDSIFVKVISPSLCGDTLLIPNAFTPNGDELNDRFAPMGNYECIETFTMQVWNRWGELIFQTNNAQTGWDGKKNGLLVPEGTYIFIMSFKMKNGSKQIHEGYVTLLR